jgi:ketosteroid isomerase-like protein
VAVASAALSALAITAIYHVQSHATVANLAATTSAVGDEDIALVQKVLGMWGAGKFMGADCKKNAATVMADDVVVDMSAHLKNTDAFKVYHGLDGSCEWTEFMATNIKWNNFKVLDLVSAGKGTVIQYQSYEPEGILSGKKVGLTSGMLVWTIKDGKAASQKMIWGDTGLLDELFVNPDVVAVSNVFKAWGGGKYAGEGCLANMKKDFSEDAVFDATGLSPHTDGLKKYKGVEAICDWTKYLSEYDMSTYKVEGLYPTVKGTVVQKGSYVPKVISTGKTTGERLDEYLQWKVEDGKIIEAKRYTWNLGVVDALWA